MTLKPTYDDSSHPGHVFEGTIPSCIGELKSLREFTLSENGLDGTIPDSIGGLTQLEVLSLTLPPSSVSLGREIVGHFPASFDQVVRLKRLYIDGFPRLEGFSSKSDFKWQNLEEIEFHNCLIMVVDMNHLLNGWSGVTKVEASLLQGDVGWLGHQPNLTSLDLSDSHLTGSVPNSFWSTSTKLRAMQIDIPGVLLSIPPEIQAMQRLTSMSIYSAEIRWPLPESLWRCSALTYINFVRSRLPGPLPSTIGHLPRLSSLEITEAYRLGPLPESLGESETLSSLSITSSGLTGTIPESFSHLPLSTLELSDNELEGQIPDIHCDICELDGNQFTGSIPNWMSQNADILALSNNMLGPDLPLTLAMNSSGRNDLRIELDNNRFMAPLPEVPDLRSSKGSISMGSNLLYGTIPANYKFYSLDLSNNFLTGSLDSILANFSGTSLVLSNNQFNGTFPNIDHLTKLDVLDISQNQLSGTVPAVPSNLLELDASWNNLQGPLSGPFVTSVKLSYLIMLDLSHNKLECPPSPDAVSHLLLGSMRHLMLSHNKFKCNFMGPNMDGSYMISVVGIDLSFNEFSDSNWSPAFPSLVLLNAASNRLAGNILFTKYMTPGITQIDLSRNQLVADISSFVDLPYLVSLNVSSNRFFGTLRPQKLPNLQSLDITDNELDGKLDLESIGNLFLKSSLQYLSIASNNRLKPMSIDTNRTGLARTQSSSPASSQAPGAICYELTFHNLTGRRFKFDENLFNYEQCDCDSVHFGRPPQSCQQCPVDSVTPLRHNLRNGSESEDNSASSQDQSVCGAETFIAPLDVFVLALPTQRSGHFHLETQSCLYTPQQLINKLSNCHGMTLNATSFALQNLTSVQHHLASQCETGSEGRLCSKCICNDEGLGGCWFERGSSLCSKCSRVLRPSQSVPLFVCLLILAILFGSVLFFLVLRSRRTQRLRQWKEISLPRRMLYRALHLVSLGNVAILISFVQITIEITHWDAYAMGFLALLNGKTESIGIRCLLPFIFSSPLSSLLVQLLIPVLAVAYLAITIGIAHVASSAITSLQRSSASSHASSHAHRLGASLFVGSESEVSDQTFDVIDSPSLNSDAYASADWLPLIGHNQVVDVPTNYPTLALFTSVSISAIKFFVFGAALAAHEYLFSTTDAFTGVKYVQNRPWMPFLEAKPLIYASIPALLVYDFAIPLTFIIVAWKIRHTSTTLKVRQYFGSLFESFDSKYFWWEIVNILKKLAIALVLRAIPATSALQSAFAVSIIAGAMVIQVSLQPWRRKTENTADTISSALLIFAIIAARSGAHLSDSAAVVYYSMALSSAFALASVITIIYQTFYSTTAYELDVLKRLEEHNKDSSSQLKPKDDRTSTSSILLLDSHDGSEPDNM